MCIAMVVVDGVFFVFVFFWLVQRSAATPLIRITRSLPSVHGMTPATKVLKAHSVHAGARVTSHPSVRKAVEGYYKYDDQASVVVDANLITSKGPGSSVNFALAIVQQLLGTEVAQRVAEPMMIPAA
jgi:transcriptional regulator GlxA family with amidase domain